MISMLCFLIFVLAVVIAYCAYRTCDAAGYNSFWGCFWTTIILSGVLLAVLGISYAFVKGAT